MRHDMRGSFCWRIVGDGEKQLVQWIVDKLPKTERELNPGRNSQSAPVEDHHCASLCIANVAQLSRIVESYGVSLAQTTYLAHNRASLYTHHLHGGAMGNEELASLRINRQKAPITLPSDEPGLRDEEGLAGQFGGRWNLLRGQ
jgi:hypothetical protein